MIKTRIYVVRHGESEFNIGKTKNLDGVLTGHGISQSKEIAEHFKKIKFDLIISSKLKRTKQTAEIINATHKTKLAVINNLEERSAYLYAKKLKIEDVDLEEKLLNNTKKLSSKEKMKYKYTPEMESAKESAERVLNSIQNYIKNLPVKNVLVISHGNLMQNMLTYLKWCEYDELPASSIKNTSYFVIESMNNSFKVIETHGIEKQKGKVRVW